jgi:imidazole glycerol-phosphate synthase subunit HisF
MRLISRIDIKNEYVIKGIHLEGLRKLGNPNTFASRYFNGGIDEIIFHDSVASLYERNNIFNVIQKACEEIFIPIIVSGGIRNLFDIENALKSGADKVAINTQAVKTPEFITEAAQTFGSQCIVGAIDCKKNNDQWEVLTENGRETTGLNAFDWACKLEDLGIGELFLTSVDMEGTKKGFDIDITKQISNKLSVPMIVSGGAGNIDHITQVSKETEVTGIAIASMLHYNIEDIKNIKLKLHNNQIDIRL